MFVSRKLIDMEKHFQGSCYLQWPRDFIRKYVRFVKTLLIKYEDLKTVAFNITWNCSHFGSLFQVYFHSTFVEAGRNGGSGFGLCWIVGCFFLIWCQWWVLWYWNGFSLLVTSTKNIYRCVKGAKSHRINTKSPKSHRNTLKHRMHIELWKLWLKNTNTHLNLWTYIQHTFHGGSFREPSKDSFRKESHQMEDNKMEGTKWNSTNKIYKS